MSQKLQTKTSYFTYPLHTKCTHMSHTEHCTHPSLHVKWRNNSLQNRWASLRSPASSSDFSSSSCCYDFVFLSFLTWSVDNLLIVLLKRFNVFGFLRNCFLWWNIDNFPIRWFCHFPADYYSSDPVLCDKKLIIAVFTIFLLFICLA